MVELRGDEAKRTCDTSSVPLARRPIRARFESVVSLQPTRRKKATAAAVTRLIVVGIVTNMSPEPNIR